MMATSTTTTLKRELSSSAPELQSVRTESKALMVTVPAQIMMLDYSSLSSASKAEISEKEDMAETTVGNTMETDDSSGMNQHPIKINSVESKNLSSRLRGESAAIISTTTTITGGGEAKTPVNMDRKTKSARNEKVEHKYESMKNGSPTIQLDRSLIRRQTRYINSIIAIKLKTLFLLVNLLLLATSPLLLEYAQAGFWTFYLPNFMKPSGYNELTDMIQKVEADINETKDNFADIQYYWGQMLDADKMDESHIYPEESACADVFPLFRKLAIEYTYIDYEHFMKPLQGYYDLLMEKRTEWFPEGPKSRTILPREWEQSLYAEDLSLKIFWLGKLTSDPDFRSKREQMVNIWRSVKRNLDSSIPCIYLRYAYRQMAEDINQLALDTNLEGMREAFEMVQAAFKRIEKFSSSDASAVKEIQDSVKKEERLNI